MSPDSSRPAFRAQLPSDFGVAPEVALAPGQFTEPFVGPTPAELHATGSYLAVVAFRLLDGDVVQRIGATADTEEHARAEVLQHLRAALGQVQTMAPDSPAVRRFIEAASHMHYLRQALSALEAAETMQDDSVAGQLRVYAIVAYGRTFRSDARAELASFIEFSPDDAALSSRLKTVRNKYAAHSENNMATTSPLLDLQRNPDGSIAIQEIRAVTIDSPAPASFVADFRGLLKRLVEQLTDALQPMKDAIRAELTSEQVATVFDDPQPLQFVTAPVAEWEPRGRRPKYPSSRFATLHLDAPASGSVDASITR